MFTNVKEDLSDTGGLFRIQVATRGNILQFLLEQVSFRFELLNALNAPGKVTIDRLSEISDLEEV